MRAVTWQGRRKVSVDTVPDPAIKEPSDAIIRVTSTNICGSGSNVPDAADTTLNRFRVVVT